MATHHNQFFNDSPLAKVTLNKRLEESSWGFFLLLIGTLLLLPTELVPQGTWLIGARPWHWDNEGLNFFVSQP